MVGVAYLSPEPGAPSSSPSGRAVAAGQTLLLIEAMKTFNQIKAPKAGTVTRILVASGSPVEYGEPLMILGISALFQKILIANRGEIALRIQRACRELGIPTVAVHSTADAEAMHVRLADESVCIGPPPAKDSYLNMPAILSAAEHHRRRRDPSRLRLPVARTPASPRWCEAHGLTFIGPSPEHIRMMGDKIAAKTAMAGWACRWCRAPTAPWPTSTRRARWPSAIGYPVLIKAAAGGGGRGMKVAPDRRRAGGGLALARAEARAAFGNDAVYHGEISRPAAPHRDAGARRRARQRGAFRRARLLACSAATRSCWRRPARRR